MEIHNTCLDVAWHRLTWQCFSKEVLSYTIYIYGRRNNSFARLDNEREIDKRVVSQTYTFLTHIQNAIFEYFSRSFEASSKTKRYSVDCGWRPHLLKGLVTHIWRFRGDDCWWTIIPCRKRDYQTTGFTIQSFLEKFNNNLRCLVVVERCKIVIIYAVNQSIILYTHNIVYIIDHSLPIHKNSKMLINVIEIEIKVTMTTEFK